MLLTNNLTVDVFVVVLVQRGHASRVAYPEVDCLRVLLESYPRPGDIFVDMGEE